MKRLEGYLAGANLGHWISQYGQKGEEHFSTYIVEEDFKKIASFGMDHVRLPVDYFLFEDDDAPGVYKEERLAYIDNCLTYCIRYGLNMILDLHHAPGYFFGNGSKNSLFTDPAMQERFIAIWQMFARRYLQQGDNLVFELMNELVWPNSDPWNELWPRCVAAIREIDAKRQIIVGGNNYNAVGELFNLKMSEDENVIYTFHMYEPHMFTHQGASWIPELKDYNKVSYPIKFDEHYDFIRRHGDIPPLYNRPIIDKRFLLDVLEPAKIFMERTGKPLYCGEYGVINNADVISATRWYRDLCAILREWGIGHAVWSYRGFSQITEGEEREVVSEEIIDIISAK